MGRLERNGPDQATCSRCGETFTIGPILYVEKDAKGRGPMPYTCYRCRDRRGFGDWVGSCLELIDFGITAYWIFAIVFIMIFSAVVGLVGRR